MSALGLLISLLIFALILVVAIWIVDIIVGALSLPAKAGQIAKVLLALLAILWLVQAFGHPLGGWYPR